MTLNEIVEKVKVENALSVEKYGPWRGNYSNSEQSDAIRSEFTEWYAAYATCNVNGEHGEIAELVDLINVSIRRIMFLTGEPDA